MADFNENKVNKISEAIVKLNTNLIKTGEIYTEIFGDIEKFNNELKESKDIINSLKKSQKGLDDSTDKLTEAEKKAKKAADALNKEREKSIKAAQKQSIKEQQLIKDARNQGRSVDDLKAKIKALTTIRDRLDRSTDKGARKFKLLTNEIRKNRQELKKTRTTQSGLIGVFKRQIGAIATMAAGYLGLSAAIRAVGGSVSVFAKFDRNISKVGAVSDATGQELLKLRNLAQDLGESTEKTAIEVAGLEINLSKLGFTSKQILQATGAILDLSTAADADLGQAATVVAATIKGFGLAATDATRVTDVMALSFSSSALDLAKFENAMSKVAPVAKNANVSLERSTALLSLLTDRGLEASIAGTSLRNIFLELSKQGLTWNEAMNKIINATDKNKIAMELFGKRGATAAIILAENAKQGDLLTQKYEGAAGAAKRMADIMRDNLVGDADKAKSALEGLSINLVTKLNPFLRQSTQGFTEFIGKINEFIKVPIEAKILAEQKLVLGLTSRLTDANNTEQDRFDILTELKDINEDIVKGLDAENLSIETLRKNVDKYNKSISQRIILETLNAEEQKKASELAEVQVKKGLEIIRLNNLVIEQDEEIGLSKLTLAEKTKLAVDELENEKRILRESLTTKERAGEFETARTLKIKELTKQINTFAASEKILTNLIDRENILKEESIDLTDRQTQLLKILGIETEEEIKSIDTNTDSIKKRTNAIIAEIEAREKQDRLNKKAREEAAAEIDPLAESIDRDILEEIENENAEELRLTQEFLDEKAQMEADDFERKKALAEKEKLLEEAKLQVKFRGLRALANIFGRQSLLGKAAFLAEKALAISTIIINTGIANAKAIAASPLTFGQPWVSINTASAGVSIALIVSQIIKSFKEGTKGKYNTPSEFITSEHGAGIEAVIKKTGEFMVTTKPTHFSGAKGSRVVSNPELRQMMNDSGKSSYGSLDLGDLRNDINRGNKEIVKSIDNIPRTVFDKDGNDRGFEEGTYTERVL